MRNTENKNYFQTPEAVIRKSSVKKVLLKISQNSQKTPVLESVF